VINYESGTGRTNQITSGGQGDTLRIIRDLEPQQIPPTWRNLLSCVKQIERVFPSEVLDIEFAFDNQDALHIFQVRALCAANRRKQRRRTYSTSRAIGALCSQVQNILKLRDGKTANGTILSDMADWNPAEMLGPRPFTLDRSLYRFLITASAWNEGRVSLGYTDVQSSELMVCLGDKPYIDVKVSLESLTPARVPLHIRRDLTSYGLAKLAKQPELHDKIEFDIAFSCLDFRIEKRLNELLAFGFSLADVRLLRDCLRSFTNQMLASSNRIMESDIALMKRLRQAQRPRVYPAKNLAEHLSIAHDLLFDCRHQAIPRFARLARLAFVGLAFLRSLRLEEIISDSFYDAFFGSLNTIASEVHIACIQMAHHRLGVKQFLIEFGHLRPMTYDITSPRYDDMPAEFWLRQQQADGNRNRPRYEIDQKSLSRINSVLKMHKIDINARQLLAFVKSAVEGREYSKFAFTRQISDALEHVALCGNALAFDRKEMANLPIEQVFTAAENGSQDKKRFKDLWREAIRRNRTAKEAVADVALPANICNQCDLLVVKYPRARPNFVTHRRVQGDSVLVRTLSRLNAGSLQNSIVLLESADPGYDWVFAYKPMGIVTKYGGAGSHMTIRCAAFDVPAAIGCGEELFERLAQTHSIILDCETGIVASIV
jgi:phosphohistidine swiveling domain-containing protein